MHRKLRFQDILVMALGATLILNACSDPRADTDESAADETESVVATGANPEPVTEQVHVTSDAYEVSGPFTHDNLEIFLIQNTGTARDAPDRNVLTLEEALTQQKVRVYETGSVQELAIENLTVDTDIYVQAGDIVRGGKQDRVLAVDLMVSPGSGRIPLNSFCVEQGRWTPRSGRASGNQGMRFESSSNYLSSKELKRAVRVNRDQAQVWAEVGRVQKLMDLRGLASPSAGTSLELTLSGGKVDEAATVYEDALGSILDGKANVVGYAFAVNGTISSADIYGSSDLFHRLWRKQLRACAVEAVGLKEGEASTFEPSSAADVASFLVVDEVAGEKREVNPRIEIVTVDAEKKVFSETRDKDAPAGWLHRSYLAK